MFGPTRLSASQIVVLLVIGFLVFAGSQYLGMGNMFLELRNNPMILVALLVGLVVGITVHEASHAAVAVALGDPTPRMMGRVSLNPLRHLDPIGSIALVVAQFGWGRPVEFNPYRLRIDPRVGSALVAAAGPVSNVLVALLGTLLLVTASWGFMEPAFQIVRMVVVINIALAAFNLLPIPPLDGFNLVHNLLPKPMAAALNPLIPYGSLILLALIFLAPSVLHVDVLGVLLRPIRQAIEALILSVVRLFGA
jgi:Zn-dependent protease